MEGILPLYKPKGMTSHDCVFKVRKILKTKKVGHTGTLDPEVTGVLPICIGRATKIAEYITDAGKAYEGEVTIGFSTDTEDAGGQVVAEAKGEKRFSRNQILQVLESLTGEIVQTPPMYSAVKVNGKKLYEYARAGQEVERPSRKVHIYEIELLDDRELFIGDTVSFKFRVSCSKGTYIRTLAVMIGEALGFPAHMSELQRVRSSSFGLEDCFTLEEAQQIAEQGEVSRMLKPLEAGLRHLPSIEVDEKIASRVINGAVLPVFKETGVKQEEPFVIFHKNRALAVYKQHETKDGCIKPVKVLRISL
ncbi:MAG: tRNA pseudouridine(55) synthase TruB [Bacillus sp. (in: firmicutes)]